MKLLTLAALMAVAIACTKPEPLEPTAPDTPTKLTKRHPGHYQVLMAGCADWHKFQPLGAWRVSNQDLVSPGRSNAITLPMPYTWHASLGIELTVQPGDSMVAMLTGPSGILWVQGYSPGQHSNTSNPYVISLPAPATSLVLFFTGETGGYINTLNLIKFQ